MKRKQKQHIPDSSNAGFTLIESLVAIIVVAVLLTAMAPVMVLSTATRMQSKRVERGVEASKAYINALQSRSIPAPSHTVQVVGEYVATADGNGGSFTSQRNKLAEVSAPSAADFTCTTPGTNGYCKNVQGASLYCFNIDDTPGCSSTSKSDLIVQAVRSTTVADGSDDSSKGYLMMVRAYRADALSSGGSLKTQKNLQGKKQATATAGMGARLLPLVEMTTEIRPLRPDYQDFCDRVSCKE